MVVFVVFRCSGSGSVAGVFSTMDKASCYIAAHSYAAYIITEHIVDSE